MFSPLKTKQFAPLVAVFAFMTIVWPGAVGAAGFNQLIGFGDSTLDNGYFRYASTGNATLDSMVVSAVANGAGGGFAGPGVMTSAMMAGRLGLSAEPVSVGGTIFANGAAYTTLLGASPDSGASPGELPGNVSTIQQIANYLASMGGNANPNALYVVNSGNNDLIFMLNQGADWIAANPNFLRDISSELAASVAALQAAGARNIMAPNSFYTATLTGPGGVIPASNADQYARAVAYGSMKWSDMTARGVRFIPADLNSLFRYVETNPALFGFSASSVLSANAPSPVAALVTSWADITPLQLQTYLFIDGKHLTTAGQRIETDYEMSLLTGPSQMSLITEGVIQGGLSRTATIQGQIDLSGQHRGPNGVNVWGSGGVSALDIQNETGFPNDNGAPFSGSLGADYQFSCGLILGAAFTAGTQTQTFSMDAGRFDQTDEALSLYAAYKRGPVWGDAVATYGLYRDNITRPVPLGLFTDENSADAAGRALALALRLGGDVSLGPVTTGPVAGMVLQQARLDGFHETGVSGVTALSYGEQIRDSAVSQLGWRIMVDLDKWRPFAEVKWNHEFADKDRMIKAAITSAVAAPYAVDAAPIASDWASASLGASYKLNSRVMLRGATSATFANPRVTSYGGEFGVSVGF